MIHSTDGSTRPRALTSLAEPVGELKPELRLSEGHGGGLIGAEVGTGGTKGNTGPVNTTTCVARVLELSARDPAGWLAGLCREVCLLATSELGIEDPMPGLGVWATVLDCEPAARGRAGGARRRLTQHWSAVAGEAVGFAHEAVRQAIADDLRSENGLLVQGLAPASADGVEPLAGCWRSAGGRLAAVGMTIRPWRGGGAR